MISIPPLQSPRNRNSFSEGGHTFARVAVAKIRCLSNLITIDVKKRIKFVDIYLTR
jgi:hypothetical protein